MGMSLVSVLDSSNGGPTKPIREKNFLRRLKAHWEGRFQATRCTQVGDGAERVLDPLSLPDLECGFCLHTPQPHSGSAS